MSVDDHSAQILSSIFDPSPSRSVLIDGPLRAASAIVNDER
jgi:hypothetical protein